jgi:TLC domain
MSQVSDHETRREIHVQTLQTFYHVFAACLIAYGNPTEYWTDYAKQAYSPIFESEPWGVNMCYILSTSYHCVLYFWDPLSNTQFKSRHLVTVMLATVLFSYGQMLYGMCILFCNYIFDMLDFFSQKLDKSRMLVMVMTKIHHMVTLALLGASYIYGYTAYGMLVSFIHDVTDVPMFVVRILRKKHPTSDMQVPVAIGIAVSWLYYRVYYFGCMILDASSQTATYPEELYRQVFILSGLTILWMFNVYWTFLVIYKGIREYVFGLQFDGKNE